MPGGTRPLRAVPVLAGVLLAMVAAAFAAEPGGEGAEPGRSELGKRMYLEGLLPSGETLTGTIGGDTPLSGERVICVTCHRRSGLGSSEGQEVVPAVTGKLLYAPLRLPTRKPPLPPEQRPAYTDDTLKRAIRDGIGAGGEAFSPFMPRYPLSDEALELLIAYLKTLNVEPAAGVTERDMHFATIVSDAVPQETRTALLDVLHAFIEQKNAGTRYETKRAASAPWHKAWVFEPYRLWQLHTWELKGPADTWPAQLAAYYREQPVFAVLSGVAEGSWRPVHEFCEQTRLPCLFPTTDLPVIDERDFYSIYLSKGMTLEGQAVARHLLADGLQEHPVVQVYRDGDARGETAAAALREAITRHAGRVSNVRAAKGASLDETFWRSLPAAGGDATLVAWLGEQELAALWAGLPEAAGGPPRIYLSTTLHPQLDRIPSQVRERLYLVHPAELPDRLARRLMRSTSWLQGKGIYAPHARRVQANAYFALKVAGEAAKHIRGFFSREYLIERIEHTLDNAIYTSIYPRISLAPGQRFVSKGSYIAKLAGPAGGDLVPVTEWLIP